MYNIMIMLEEVKKVVQYQVVVVDMNLLPLAIYYSLVRIVMALLPTGVRVHNRYLLPSRDEFAGFY